MISCLKTHAVANIATTFQDKSSHCVIFQGRFCWINVECPTRTFDAGEDLWRFRGAIGCLSKHNGSMMKDIHGRRIICTHLYNMQISLCIYIYIFIQWHIFNRLNWLNVNDEITSESNWSHLHLLYNFSDLFAFLIHLNLYGHFCEWIFPLSHLSPCCHQIIKGPYCPGRRRKLLPPVPWVQESPQKKKTLRKKLRIWRDGSLASRSFHYFFQLPKNLLRPNVPTFDVSCRRFCLPQAMAVQSIQFGDNQSTGKIQRACVWMRQILVYKWNPYPFWACNWTTWMQTACHVQNNSWNRTSFCTLLDLCVSSLHSGAMLIFSVSFSILSDDPSANWQAR